MLNANIPYTNEELWVYILYVTKGVGKLEGEGGTGFHLPSLCMCGIAQIIITIYTCYQIPRMCHDYIRNAPELSGRWGLIPFFQLYFLVF